MSIRRVLLAAMLLLVCQPAFAEKRVVLIIANSAYKNVPPLTNPVNDGSVMTATFKDAGFDVVNYQHDLSARETRRALRDFADTARDADIAVVYYAGHGMEVEGSNYLIPVDARLERDTDVYDETLSLDRILVAIEPARRLRLVILDACRDNPFARSMQRTLATRGIGRGLAKVEPNSPNTLIAYSAKAGSTAQDGDGKNSPFTIALSRHIATPGLDVRKALGFVRDDVLKSTGNTQEPFVYGSLGGDDVPLVPGTAHALPQVQTPPSAQSEARRDYELALQVGNKGALNAFLAQYPDGFYANLARLQIDKLTAEENRAAAAEKARATEAERVRLATEGGRKDVNKDALAKAEADAKAAEQARIVAERANQMAQQQAADAERQRQDMRADQQSGQLASNQPQAGSDRSKGDSAAAAAPTDKGPVVASLNAGASPVDLAKATQLELQRVGCLNDDADGNWGSASQRSLSQFNRYAGTRLDTREASADALDAIRRKQARVCPLLCRHGYEADGDHCSRIVCAEGSFVNDDNECETRHDKKAVAKRNSDDNEPSPRRRQRAERNLGLPDVGVGVGMGAGAGGVGVVPAPGFVRPQLQAARPPRVQGQIFCDAYHCRPVQRGCHLEFHGGGGPGNNANAEVCN